MHIFSSVIAEVSADVIALLPDALSPEICDCLPAAQYVAMDSDNALQQISDQLLIADSSQNCSNILNSKANFLQNQLSVMQCDVRVICTQDSHIDSLKVCGSSWEKLVAVYSWLSKWAENIEITNSCSRDRSVSSNCDFIRDNMEHGSQTEDNLMLNEPPETTNCQPVTRSSVRRSKDSNNETKYTRKIYSVSSKKTCKTKGNSPVKNNEDAKCFKETMSRPAESTLDNGAQVTNKTTDDDNSNIEVNIREKKQTKERQTHKLLNRCKKVHRSRTSTVAMHQDAAEINAQEYRCDVCDYVSSKERYLLFHKLRVHGKREHQCTVCQRSFGVLKDLNQHLRFHNEHFCCEHCGKTLKSRYALMLHIARIHNGAAPRPVKHYLCTLCGKMCRSKTDYTAHRNKEHLRIQPFHCDICDAGFFARSNLSAHEKIHSDIRTFKCKHCDKAFKQRQGLRIHLAVHAVDRPYQCDRCSKSFTQRSALVRHTRTHTSSRPYLCLQCPATFNDCSILRRHLVAIHKVNTEQLRECIKAACGKARILEKEGPVDSGSTVFNDLHTIEQPLNSQSVADTSIHPFVYSTDDSQHLTRGPDNDVSTLPNSNVLMGVLAKSESISDVDLCTAADPILILSGYDSAPYQVNGGTSLMTLCPDTNQYVFLDENWRSWRTSNTDSSMNMN